VAGGGAAAGVRRPPEPPRGIDASVGGRGTAAVSGAAVG